MLYLLCGEGGEEGGEGEVEGEGEEAEGRYRRDGEVGRGDEGGCRRESSCVGGRVEILRSRR